MRLFLLLLAMCFAPLAYTQDALPDTTTDTAATQAANEAATQDILSEDAQIQARLNGIFDQVEDLAEVSAVVSNGVVTLSGTVANEGFANQAVTLAEKTEGAVLVQDKIERTLEVGDNVGSVFKNAQTELTGIVRALPLILVALVTIALFWLLGGWLSRRKSFWNKLAPNPFLGELLSQTSRVILIVLGLVVALNIIGAQTLLATVLGGAGVIGIAVGFAIRDTLENYFASLMLSLRQPFRAGDHVLIEDHEGVVIRLTSRATILMTMDGNHLRIPNSTVFKAVILNYTTNPERRFSFVLGVDAADDPVAAMQMGLSKLKANPHVVDEPSPAAIIEEVGDSNILIKFFGWVDQRHADFGKARSLSIREVKDALEENGFSLPEPIYRLKIDNAPAGMTVKETTPEPAKTPDRTAPLEPMDVAPDRTIGDKVQEELQKTEADNLLDEDRPTE